MAAFIGSVDGLHRNHIVSDAASTWRGAALAASRVAVVAGALGVAACGPASTPLDEPARQGSPGRGEGWTTCRIGGVGNARCARVIVPEDHDAPSGATIELEVAVLPALAADRAPSPFVVLVGGPGQAATEVGPSLGELLERVRKHRDVLLIDQRGTGSSSPLDCTLHDEGQHALPPLSTSFDTELPPQRLRRCLDGYEVDPANFATPDAVADLEAVRAFAGYERLDVYGASYGTRVALAYARRHPTRVRTMTLDGVAPVDMALPLPMAKDGQRALDLAVERCRADAACARRFPAFGDDVTALLEGLASPRSVTIAHPRTGEPETVELDRDGVAAVLRGALYSPQTTALLPLVVAEARADRFGPLAALALAGGGAGDTVSLGMFLSVVCSEDRVAGERADVEAETRGTFLGSRSVAELWEACEVWPRATLPEDYFEPVQVDVPTLILSGEGDPATPPRWGEAVAAHLRDARHVVVPGLGHGTWSSHCVVGIIDDFVDGADPGQLETGCVEDVGPTPFFVGPAGPALGGGHDGEAPR